MTANINLIKIDGKPLEKLLEVLQFVFGKLYEPREIRKRADAKAYAIDILQKAEIKAFYESKELQNDYVQKIHQRILQKEIRNQLNLDNIVFAAADILKDKANVSNKPLDKDWINNFFSFAENISNSDMQVLWGRILSGEIESPGSFSLRTLDLLRKMNQKEASCFSNFAKLSITYMGVSFILNFMHIGILKEKYDITFSDRLLLEELGLVSTQDLVTHLEPFEEEFKIDEFEFGDTTVLIKRSHNNQETNKRPHIGIIAFTNIGQELLSLIEYTPDQYYLKLFASFIRKDIEMIKYSKNKTNLEFESNEMIELPISDEEIQIEKMMK